MTYMEELMLKDYYPGKYALHTKMDDIAPGLVKATPGLSKAPTLEYLSPEQMFDLLGAQGWGAYQQSTNTLGIGQKYANPTQNPAEIDPFRFHQVAAHEATHARVENDPAYKLYLEELYLREGNIPGDLGQYYQRGLYPADIPYFPTEESYIRNKLATEWLPLLTEGAIPTSSIQAAMERDQMRDLLNPDIVARLGGPKYLTPDQLAYVQQIQIPMERGLWALEQVKRDPTLRGY